MSRIIKSYAAKTNGSQGKTIQLYNYLTRPDEQAEPERMPSYMEEDLLAEAEKQAAEIMEAAAAKARKIEEQIEQDKQRWEAAKQQAMEEGYQAGFAKGVEEGRTQGTAEYQSVIATAQDIVQSARADYEKHIQAAEHTILELGLAAAKKIIGLELERSDEAFLSIVKRALKETRDSTEVQLHIHPEQYQEVFVKKEELDALFPKKADLYIYPDTEMAPGSCVIESENGRIDAAVDSQLEEMKKQLAAILEGEA